MSSSTSSSDAAALPNVPVRVFIEGNIGSGKSCVISCLQNRGWVCTAEPLQKWDDVLQLFYQHPKKYAFHLQHCVMSSIAVCNARVCQLNSSERVLVFERSLQSSKLFTKNCLNRGYITPPEGLLLERSINEFEKKNNRRDVYIYLRCPIQECTRRILQRSRASETNTKSFLSKDMKQYLVELNQLHEQSFVSNTDKTVFVVDASQSIGQVIDAVSAILVEL